MTDKVHDVCPLEKAKKLDGFFRRLLHNPKRILKSYAKKGMVVLDFGCGPGLFSIAMSKMVGNSGKVIAVDLQQGMLDILKTKIKEEMNIEIHKCNEDSIGVTEDVDFVLGFYVVHEVPNQKPFFTEVKKILKPGSLFLIVEPNHHVSKDEFETIIGKAKEIGFKEVKRPKIFMSKTVVLKI